MKPERDRLSWFSVNMTLVVAGCRKRLPSPGFASVSFPASEPEASWRAAHPRRPGTAKLHHATATAPRRPVHALVRRRTCKPPSAPLSYSRLLNRGQRMGIAGQEPAAVGLFAIDGDPMPGQFHGFSAGVRCHG
jgi:hypothetical protein